MRLIIIGGGFAGVWAAIAAAEERNQRGGPQSPVDITLISRDPWLTIRPRLYERSLEGVRVHLDPILRASGLKRLEGSVEHIDSSGRRVILATRVGQLALQYDRLVLAAGSELRRPAIPGIDLAFSVDTYAEAERLDRHLQSVRATRGVGARGAIVVVGAGFTGLEVATELASRHHSATPVAQDSLWRVVLVDGGGKVGADLSEDARSTLVAPSTRWASSCASVR
jgi:NADH dehydrogenase